VQIGGQAVQQVYVQQPSGGYVVYGQPPPFILNSRASRYSIFFFKAAGMWCTDSRRLSFSTPAQAGPQFYLLFFISAAGMWCTDNRRLSFSTPAQAGTQFYSLFCTSKNSTNADAGAAVD
jgi:hypothetical protein